MQRYFLKSGASDGDILISGDDFHHITRVMRMVEGDHFYAVIDGRTALAQIDTISTDVVVARPLEWLVTTNELPVKVTLVNGLPKGDKLELIVQKGTELGAFAFIPFNATRSIVKWDKKKGEKKVERLRKIAKEAAEQSHRSSIPVINEPIDFNNLVKLSEQYDVKIVAFEEEAKQGETTLFAQTLKTLTVGQTVMIVFGPEGGISEQEISQLMEHGFQSCGFGPRIMRTETAPLYAMAAISYEMELAR